MGRDEDKIDRHYEMGMRKPHANHPTLDALRARQREYRIATTLRRGKPYPEPAPPTGDGGDPHEETGGEMPALAIAVWVVVVLVIVAKNLLKI